MIRSVRVEARANGTTVETIEVTYRSAPQHNHNVYEVACPVCAERFVAAGAHPELGYDELGDIGHHCDLSRHRKPSNPQVRGFRRFWERGSPVGW